MHSREEKTLFQIFYKFFLLKNQNKDKAEVFANAMESIFTQPHNIVTISSNLSDGIGDYASHVYFIEKLSNLMAEYKNVNLKNISFVSEEKQFLSKIVRNNKIDEESVCVMGNDNAVEYDYSQKASFVGVPNAKEKELLSNFMSEADFVFNFAIGLTSRKAKFNSPYSQLSIQNRGGFVTLNPVKDVIIPAKDNAFVSSWVQYSFISKENSELNDNYVNQYINIDYKGPIFSEYSMGIHENQVGLRFDQSILAKINKDKNELLSLFSDEFNKRAFNHSNLQQQSFAIGYLQSGSASRGFALMAVQTSPEKQDMNILVNVDHFLSCPLAKKQQFEIELKNLGVSTLEFIKNDETQTIQLTENPETPRKLRLINFKGISDSDKAVFYCLAEMVGASGDNSISEQITVGLKDAQTSLPFPQQFITSDSSSIQSILEEVKDFQEKTGSNHNELCMYLEHLFTSTSHPSYKRVDFTYDRIFGETIKINREIITQSWHQFCDFLYSKRNNDTYFNELLVSYIFHYLLIHNDLNTFVTLAEMLGVNAFKNESLLHLAVKANNTKAVAFILENKLCDINMPHSFNNYTALHMAAFAGNRDIVDLLVQHGVLSQDVIEALKIAMEKSHFYIFNVLLETIDKTDIQINRQEYLDNFLCIAIANNNFDAIQAVLNEGANINCIKDHSKSNPLEIAIDHKNIELVEFLLKNGADANLCATYGSPPLFSACGVTEIFKLLLDHNGDVNRTHNGHTLIDHACGADKINLEVIALLLDRGADVNQKVVAYDLREEHNIQETILHSAARQGKLELIKFLLSRGADSTLQNSKQQTPLEVYLSMYNEESKYNVSQSGIFASNSKANIIKAFESARKDNDNDISCRIF